MYVIWHQLKWLRYITPRMKKTEAQLLVVHDKSHDILSSAILYQISKESSV